MTPSTKAQEALESLTNAQSFSGNVSYENIDPIDTYSTIFNAEEAATIREALSLLHRVQSGEVKVLGREPTREIVDALYAMPSWETVEQKWFRYWDAAPAKPDSDGV